MISKKSFSAAKISLVQYLLQTIDSVIPCLELQLSLWAFVFMEIVVVRKIRECLSASFGTGLKAKRNQNDYLGAIGRRRAPKLEHSEVHSHLCPYF